MKLVGKVLWWNDRDGFGVIEDAKGNEYYFDSSVISLRPRQKILHNSFVEFQVNPNIEDTLCAYKIQMPTVEKRKNIQSKHTREIEKAASADL